MSPTEIWLIGIGVTVGIATCGGIVTLVVYAVKIGMAAGEISRAVKAIEPRLVALDQIPRLDSRMGTVENAVARAVSDIAGLRETNGEFRGRLNSITEDT